MHLEVELAVPLRRVPLGHLGLIYGIAAIVLGGTGNMYGAIVGAVVVAWLPERFRGFSSRRYFVFGVVLVLVMVFRPQGLMGKA